MLSYTLGRDKGICISPFCLISQCLMKVQKEKSTILLVAPAWPAQPWYATVLKMCIQDPILLPTVPRLLLSDKGESHPLILNDFLQFVAWVVSGNPCKRYSYPQKLKNSWGKGTTSSYNSAWKKWSGWCIGREVHFQHL